jgi:hypothetical protein
MKRIAGWMGRRVGWGMRSSWDIFKGIKGFAWITYHLMVTTKWFGDHITDYTESFFSNVIDTFTQEEDFLNREVHLLITVEKD